MPMFTLVSFCEPGEGSSKHNPADNLSEAYQFSLTTQEPIILHGHPISRQLHVLILWPPSWRRCQTILVASTNHIGGVNKIVDTM